MRLIRSSLLLLTTAVALSAAALPTAAAPPPDVVRQLMKLSPSTRIEQRCNRHAVRAIGREIKGFAPDEVVTYAFSQPQARPEGLAASGAAFRSKGAWYHLSYECSTADDGLRIAAFHYNVGAKVPRADWDSHYLVP